MCVRVERLRTAAPLCEASQGIKGGPCDWMPTSSVGFKGKDPLCGRSSLMALQSQSPEMAFEGMKVSSRRGSSLRQQSSAGGREMDQRESWSRSVLCSVRSCENQSERQHYWVRREFKEDDSNRKLLTVSWWSQLRGSPVAVGPLQDCRPSLKRGTAYKSSFHQFLNFQL